MMRRCMARVGSLVLGLGLLLTVPAAHALIMRLVPLREVLDQTPFILVARVEKLDPERPAMVLTVAEDLKGKPEFRRLPILLKGDSEAEKLEHTPKLLKRLGHELPVVLFITQRGKRYTAFAYSNGTWFQVVGQQDGEAVRWNFTHCEPYLRRTFKGTTAELRQAIVDGLAGKQTPEPNEKEEPGLGPEIKPESSKSQGRASGGPVFAVIPTVLVGGPLALLAILFPAIFGGVLIFFRRWLAAFSIAGLNSTLALLHSWYYPEIKQLWWGTYTALWLTMTVVAALGVLWAWSRHLSALQAAPSDQAPRRSEHVALWVLSLFGLAAMALCVSPLLVPPPPGGSAFFRTDLLLSPTMAPLFVLCVGLWAGTLWTVWQVWTASRSTAARPSVPGEGIMLLTLVCASTALGLTTASPSAPASGAITTSDEPAGRDGKLAVRPVGVVWKFEPKDRGTMDSSPLLDGDRVFVAAAHRTALDAFGTLYCLDKNTGKALWTFDNDGELKQVFSTPCLVDGRLYVGEGYHQDRACNLHCIDAATGKKLWAFTTASHVESSPFVAGGKVWFGAGDDGVWCLDAATGKEVWHCEKLHVDCSPVVQGDRLYAGSGVGDVYRDTAVFCLDANTGTEVWRMPVELPAWGSPAVAPDGKHVYFGLGNGNMVQSAPNPAGELLCLDARNGRRLWNLPLADAVLCRPALEEGRLYFTARDGHCWCVDRNEGFVVWKQPLGSPAVTAPILVGKGRARSVFAVASGGQVCCLAAADGSPRWTFDVAKETRRRPYLFSSPAAEVRPDGGGERRRIYFGAGLDVFVNAEAALYCFEDRYGAE